MTWQKWPRGRAELIYYFREVYQNGKHTKEIKDPRSGRVFVRKVILAHWDDFVEFWENGVLVYTGRGYVVPITEGFIKALPEEDYEYEELA